MKKPYLITPGPTPIPPQVSAKEGLPVLHHRTTEFRAIFAEVIEGLKEVLQTKNDVFLLTSSGTAAMESAVANLVNAGETAIVATSGAFGDRWGKLLEAYGAQVVYVKAEWGRAVNPTDLAKALKLTPQAKAVFCQHTETSTGVVTDLSEFGRLVAGTPAVLVVDAISGLAGQELQTDAWKLDVVVSGSQKGLMTAPGLSVIAAGPKAWPLIEASKNPRFYLDWRKMKKSIPDNETPFTPAVTLVVSMDEALRQIKAEGLPSIWARHAWMAQATRAGIAAMNLELFAKDPCNVLTSVVVPEGIDGKKLVKRLREDYGVSVAGGQAHLLGKIFRLAHMGYMERFDVIIALSAVEMMLHDMGRPIELGKGVAAAERILSRPPQAATAAATSEPAALTR
jgi:aspartate aminotransferase-like enzyme